MSDEKETWDEYGKLVLNELERLNENYERMQISFDAKFQEMNTKLNKFEGIERSSSEQKVWMEKVSDVWSPSQMKEARDEIYKQKNKWVATVAIVTFTQIIIGIIVALWRKI